MAHSFLTISILLVLGRPSSIADPTLPLTYSGPRFQPSWPTWSRARFTANHGPGPSGGSTRSSNSACPSLHGPCLLTRIHSQGAPSHMADPCLTSRSTLGFVQVNMEREACWETPPLLSVSGSLLTQGRMAGQQTGSRWPPALPHSQRGEVRTHLDSPGQEPLQKVTLTKASVAQSCFRRVVMLECTWHWEESGKR
jgi:hypothetical protein